MPTAPAWVLSAPWSLNLPTEHPLRMQDIQAHQAGLGDGGVYPLLIVCGRPRCAHPYLIPQTSGTTGRFIFGWALHAPLIALREITAAVPLELALRDIPSFNPRVDAVVDMNALIDLRMPDLFTQLRRPPTSWSGDIVIGRIRPEAVSLAPSDTPIHAFSHHLADFPGL
jgi:hypothetical protein